MVISENEFIGRGEALREAIRVNHKYYVKNIQPIIEPYRREEARIGSELESLFMGLIDTFGVELLFDVELSKEFYSLSYLMHRDGKYLDTYYSVVSELFANYPLLSFSDDFYNYDYSRDDAFINLLSVPSSFYGGEYGDYVSSFSLLERIYDKQLEIDANVYIKTDMKAHRGSFIIRRCGVEWQLLFRDLFGVESVNFANEDSSIFWDFISMG